MGSCCHNLKNNNILPERMVDDVKSWENWAERIVDNVKVEKMIFDERE